MPPMVMKLVFNRIESAPMPFFAKPVARGISQKVKRGFIDPNLQRIVAYMEAELGRGEWFAGDAFTAADIQMSFPVQAAMSRAGGGERPNMIQALVMTLLFYGTIAITWFFGLLVVFFNARRRAAHDFLAGTVVVRRLPASAVIVGQA